MNPPGQGEWTISVGNTSATPVEGVIQVGPLPAGVKVPALGESDQLLRQKLVHHVDAG